MPLSLNMSTSVQAVFDYIRLNVKLQNFFGQGGIVNQPGLMMAQFTNEMLLSLNEPWKFNRQYLGGTTNNDGHFMPTQFGVQDFLHAGSSCFSLMNQAMANSSLATGGVGIDLDTGAVSNGYSQGYTAIPQTRGITCNPATGIVTVQFLQPQPGFVVGQTVFMSGNTQPCYNSQFYYAGQVANPAIQGGISTPMTSAWKGGFVITAIPDIYHIQFAATTAMLAGVTSITVATGTATVTAANAFVPGLSVMFGSLTGANNTWLNGLTQIVLSATPTSFTFATSTADYGASASAGYGFVNSGAPGINNWGYMETVSATDFNSLGYPQPVTPWIAVDRIAETYTSTGDRRPSVAMIQDQNNGILRFRLSEPMGTYPVAINFGYQARAPKFKTPQDIIQWRDDLLFTFVEICLWMAYRQAAGVTATETEMQYKIAMGAIAQARIADDREDTGEAMVPDRSLMR